MPISNRDFHDQLIDKFIEQEVIKGHYYKNYQILDCWSDPYRYHKSTPREIDLLIVTDEVVYICEFKTKFNAENIERAVGQLMIYEKLYRKKSQSRKLVKKVAVFYGEDLTEDSIEEIAKPGSVMWEILTRKSKSLLELAEIFDELDIILYIYTNDSFHCYSQLSAMSCEESEYFEKWALRMYGEHSSDF